MKGRYSVLPTLYPAKSWLNEWWSITFEQKYAVLVDFCKEDEADKVIPGDVCVLAIYNCPACAAASPARCPCDKYAKLMERTKRYQTGEFLPCVRCGMDIDPGTTSIHVVNCCDTNPYSGGVVTMGIMGHREKINPVMEFPIIVPSSKRIRVAEKIRDDGLKFYDGWEWDDKDNIDIQPRRQREVMRQGAKIVIPSYLDIEPDPNGKLVVVKKKDAKRKREKDQ
jgi:hypothetical protein